MNRLTEWLSRNHYFAATMCAIGCLLLIIIVTGIMMPRYGDKEISVAEYKLLRWYVEMDCSDLPDHCKSFKDQLSVAMVDGKITNDEEIKYLQLVREARYPTDPNAKAEAQKELLDIVKE